MNGWKTPWFSFLKWVKKSKLSFNLVSLFRQAQNRRQETIFLILIILGALFFRLYDFEKRTLWNVDQSLLLWQIKKVVVDHKFTLIGLHFFSLLKGAVYRTAIFNWIMAIPMFLFGLSVKTAVIIFALVAIISMVTTAQISRQLGGKVSWQLALLLYAFSWFIRVTEMKLWYASLMIPLSALGTWWLFRENKQFKFSHGFFLGLLLGFGFSLHFVVIWLIIGVIAYWFIADRSQLLLKTSSFFLGLLIMISPLVIFNIRHDFVMNQGFINMITSSAVEDQANFEQRLSLASHELPCLIGRLTSLSCSGFLSLTLLIGAVIINLFSRDLKIRKFQVYALIQIIIGFIGLYYAGRLSYSSQHYIYYLIPPLVIIFSLAISRLTRTYLSLIAIALLISYIYFNITNFLSFKTNDSYYHKKELARFIYSLQTDKTIGIKFWDQETLAYDFVFYEAANSLNLPFEKVNLIERWGADEPCGYIYLNEKPEIEGKVLKFGNNKLIIESSPCI